MLNTAVKDVLQVYGFELKEAFNDNYTFENSKGDKVIFNDVRDPTFRIVENRIHKNSYLNQVDFDGLKVWLIQNQTASPSVVQTYSWFKDFIGALKPDPVVVGSEIANKVIIALFSAAALVYGGAIARGIADRIRRIGEKTTDENMTDAIALIEQARNKLIKEGTKEQRKEFESKVEEILHPYVKKSGNKFQKTKIYSESELESYSFKSSVVDALKILRNLSADFVEKVVASIFSTCGDVLGRDIGKSVSKKIYAVDDEHNLDMLIDAAATEVDATYKSIPGDDEKKEFAKKINNIIKPNKDDKKKPWERTNPGLRQKSTYSNSEGGLEASGKLKDLLIKYQSELNIGPNFIEEIFSKFDNTQIVSAIQSIIEEGGVSDNFKVEFSNLTKAA